MKTISNWQKELETALLYKKAILLTGNIFDKYLYKNNKNNLKIASIKECLKEFMVDKYNVVFYDPINKIQRLKGTEKKVDESSTAGFDAELGSPPAPARGGQKQISIEDDISNICQEMGQIDGKPLCYIIQFADFIANVNDMNNSESRNTILRLGKLIEDMPEINRLIIIFKENSVIPQNLYKENPCVKLIEIPNPERDDLKVLFEDIFEMKDNEDNLREAVNITDGLKILEIEQIVNKVSEDTNWFEKFKELVKIYKFGSPRDSWMELTIDRLNIAGDWFKGKTEDRKGMGIIGQEEPVAKLVDSLFKARTGVTRLVNNKRPRLTLFFAGPTGVGKTLTAKRLAEFLFGSEDKYVRFDMSEYQQDFQINRLLGAPPGYIGYADEGILTKTVKQRPFSVILFDEIEKAHPRIFDIFLQILDDGRLTNSRGETIFFSESAIIFTSNIGARANVIAKDAGGKEIQDEYSVKMTEEKYSKELRNRLVGKYRGKIPVTTAEIKEIEEIRENIRNHFKASVKAFFREEISRIELLNRIGEDNIIVYGYIIEPEDIKKLINNSIQHIKREIEKNYSNKKVILKEDEIYNYFFENCKDKVAEYGGRGLDQILSGDLLSIISIGIVKSGGQEKEGSFKVFVNDKGELDCERVKEEGENT